VAIKFYMEHEAFTTEQQLFQKSSLRSIMPAVTAIEPNSLVRATLVDVLLSSYLLCWHGSRTF
jgi:hypothetical protein